MEKNTGKELISGLTVLVLPEVGLKTKLMDLELILGPTVGSLKAIGKITICMVKANTLGQMVEVMREITLTIKKRDTESILGQTVVNIMDSG